MGSSHQQEQLSLTNQDLKLQAEDLILLDTLAEEMHIQPNEVLSKALLTLKQSLANDKLLAWVEQ